MNSKGEASAIAVYTALCARVLVLIIQLEMKCVVYF